MEFRQNYDSAVVGEKKLTVRNWWGRLCFSSFSKYAIPSFFLGLLFVAGVYLSVEVWLLPQDEIEIISTCHLEESYYVACVPNGLVEGPEDCLKLACCWREDLKLCYHAFPSRYGYKIQSTNQKEGILTSLRETSPFGSNMKKKLNFRIDEIDDCRVRIALITNPRESAMDSKSIVNSKNVCSSSKSFSGGNSKLVAYVQKPQFSVILKRESDSSIVLSTGRVALIVTDNYWEWTLHLPSTGGLYGLQHLEWNGSSDWIYNSENASVVPAFLAIDSKGKAASCYLEYDGPLEVQVLNVSKLVVLRGVSVPQELRLVVMSAVNGIEASRQLRTLLYTRKESLAGISLGLHVCPELEESSDALAKFERQMAEARAPWDSHCMYRRLGLALEHGANLSQVEQVRSFLIQQGRILSPHLTPMLFDNPKSKLQANLARELCLLRNGSEVSEVYVGLHGKRTVVYPDWRKAEAREYLRASLENYTAELSSHFIFLRDSWPKDDTNHATFSDTKHFDYLPEEAAQLLSGRNLPWDLEGGTHYAWHNSYAPAFLRLVNETNVAAVSLADHPEGASWENLRGIFDSGLVSSMLGQLPAAMYVCAAGERGYNRLNDELCLRWYGLAVAWPHVLSLPENSPGGGKLGRQGATRAAKLLRLRASLATYQRTALAKHALDGSPLFAATSLLYAEERQPEGTSRTQFLWADSLLIGLVFASKRSQLWMWIPGKHAWRHLQDGLPEEPTGEGIVSVLATVGQIVMLLRPGRIIPLHDAESENVAKSTAAALGSNLTLVVNGICHSKELHSCRAEGSVYYGADMLEEDAFLQVQLVNATLVLSNVTAIRSRVCVENFKGSSSLDALQFLNDGTEFAIGINLCDLSSDTWIVDLSKTEKSSPSTEIFPSL